MRKNVIALAVLLILGLGVLLMFREKPSVEKKEIAAAIVPIPADSLDTIRIKRFEGKDEKAVQENIVLKKKDGVWRMAEPVDYPVIESTVTHMAEVLGELKVIDVISDNKESHAKFELDDRHGIEVAALKGDKELARMIVGKSKVGMTFVRLPGKDQVYRIQGYHRSAFDKSVENLRDKAVLKMDLEKVRKIAFNNAGGELVLERTGQGDQARITPVGVEIKNFDETKAKSLVRSAVGITARGFVDQALTPEQTGLTESAAKVVVDAEVDGKLETVTMWMGNDLDDKSKTFAQTYVKTSKSDQIFLLAKTMADRFKPKKDDFARTDEDVAKEEARRKEAEKNAQAGASQVPAMAPPGMAGRPGTQQIPPDVMKKIQEQMAAQQANQ